VNGQHEVLVESVEQAEGDVVVIKLAIDGIVREIGQHVVHPAMFHFMVKPDHSDRRAWKLRESGGFSATVMAPERYGRAR